MAATPTLKNLTASEVERLNSEFYGASSAPHDYVRFRMRNCLIGTLGLSALLELEASNYEPKVLAQRLSASRRLMSIRDREALAIESVMLAHHAAETLLRLYFAHQGRPKCPWYAGLERRHSNQFKDRARELAQTLDGEEFREESTFVCMGPARKASSSVRQTDTHWINAQKALPILFKYAIDTLLDDAHVYNAAKHGQMLVAQTSTAQDVPEVTTLTTLTIGQTDASRKRAWQQSTDNAYIEANLCMVSLCATVIENVWLLGRARHTKQKGELRRFPTVKHVKASLPDAMGFAPTESTIKLKFDED